MPNLGDVLDDFEDEGTESDDGAPAGDPSTAAGDPKSSDKRVKDFQSLADRETARANKAEKRLKALEAALASGDSEEGKPATSVGGDAQNQMILDMARMFAVSANPKLAEFGLEASDLTGSTPSEIAQSAAALIARFEKVETRVRNKVLADNGLAPEIVSGKAPETQARDFSEMGKEDFDKLLNSVLGQR